ncbi:MAG: hypothetical protein ACI841_005058, partial [Planctomycetota bacterium]
MSSTLRYAFYGHHKCASTWVHSVIDQVVADTGHRVAYLYDSKNFDGDLRGHIDRERVEFLSYVNADIEHTKDLPAHKAFHMIRDPRDLIVSSYFSHKGSHPTHAWPELIPYREKLKTVPKDEGLMLELEFSSPFLNQISTWDYEQEHVLEFRQEDFTPDPYRAFLRAFEFIGLLDGEHYSKASWFPYLLQSATNIANRLSKGAFPLRFPMHGIPGERLLGIVYDNRYEKFA